MADEKKSIIIDLKFDVSDFTQSAAKLNKEIATINKQQAELKKQGQEGSIQYQKNSEALRENRKELAEVNKTISNLTTANKANAGSNEQLKAQLSVMTLEYNKLSESERNNSARGKELFAQINQVTSSLKENEEAVGNNRRSVGDYEKGTKRLEAELKGLRKEFNSLSKEEQNNTQVGGVLIQKIEETNNELILSQKELDKYNSMLGKSGGEVQGFGKALEGTPFGAFISGIKATGAAFLANPIGLIITAIVAALALLYKSFTRTEEGSNKVKKGMAVLSGAFSALLKVIEPVANFISDVIIHELERLGKIVDSTAKAVSNSLKFLGFNEAAKSVDTFVNSSGKAVKSSLDLADAEAELTKVKREQRVVQLQAQNDAEKQRQIRDDESLSIEERKKANFELGRILEEQSTKELAMAQKAMDVALLRQKIDGDEPEILDEIAQAKLELIDIEERITGQKSEQLVNINSLNRDAAQQAKDAAAKAKERLQQEIETNKKAIDLFILQQGPKAKSLEEELKLAEDVSAKKLAILETERKKKLITEQDYQIQSLQITQELEGKKAQLLIDVANRELNLIIQNNQTKIDNNQFLNDELYQQELARLDLVAQAKKDFAAKQLEEGVIDRQAYLDAIKAVDDENDIIKEELRIEKKEADNEQAMVDLENQREIDNLNFQDNYAIIEQQNETLRNQELNAAKKNGADVNLINKKYDALELKNKQILTDQTLGLYGDMAGQLSQLAGKSSAEGKAFALAQALISTYQGIAAGVAAGYPQAIPLVAAAALTGFTAVKNITSTKAAKGGIFGGESHSNGGTKGYFSDGTQVEVERGELFAVVNKQNTSMLNRLSDLNSFGGNGNSFFERGGIKTFANGGIGFGNVSTSVEQSQNNVNQMMEVVANLPTPVVAVQDINEVQYSTNQVQVRANL